MKEEMIYNCKNCDLKHYEMFGESWIEVECKLKKSVLAKKNLITCIIDNTSTKS